MELLVGVRPPHPALRTPHPALRRTVLRKAHGTRLRRVPDSTTYMGINAFIDLRPELLPDELPYSVELQVLARPLCPRFCAAAIRPTLCALGTVPHGGQSERQVERVAPALRGISLPRACSSTEAQGVPGETPPSRNLEKTPHVRTLRGAGAQGGVERRARAARCGQHRHTDAVDRSCVGASAAKDDAARALGLHALAREYRRRAAGVVAAPGAGTEGFAF